ncbi:MAG: DHA2 family efflux MFS transporter permease subunit [Candidatus Obscuribacterales bacterium]|nr:DHA2 family efflux MFS transporter permease subunit [Steroidobacteraceae bacterium]
MIVFLLSALDQTIVSTAMPRIIAELHGLEMYSWTATAYMLTSTVMIPIYGKLGDLYGRKIILIVGVSIFLFGSALCGLAGEFGDLPILGSGMVQLIIFRAIQGLGSGALFSGAFATIADLYPPRERSKVMGLFGAVFGFASVIGPAIGGFFTDHGTTHLFGYEVAGWRWVFYVNLPIGLISLFMLIFKMRRTNHSSGGRVDYWGAVFLIAAFVPLLLALTWGGHSYAWDSALIISLFIGAVLSLAVFIAIEKRFADPIMPLSLLRNPTFAITNAAAFVISMAFLGVVMFMPLYMQLVLGVSATQSGFALLPLMIGIIVSSIVSGRVVSKTGHYKPIMIVGCVVLFIGVVFLTQIGPDTTLREVNWRLLVMGLGLGPVQSLYSLAAQNAAPAHQVGIATSNSQFFRQIGSTVGIAIFGTVLTHNLVQELPKRLPQMPGMSAQTIDLGQMQARAMNPGSIRAEIEATIQARKLVIDAAVVTTLVNRVERGIKEGFSSAIVSMLKSALWIVGLGFLITLFVPVLPLRERDSPIEAKA